MDISYLFNSTDSLYTTEVAHECAMETYLFVVSCFNIYIVVPFLFFIQLEELLKLSSPFVKCLIVRQLLPPPQDLPADDEEGDG